LQSAPSGAQEVALTQAGRRHRRRRAATFVFGLAALWCAGVHAETVFATEGNYSPWNETAADGRLAGFDIDLVDALCRDRNDDCRMVTAPFPGMMDRLAAGEFDAIISGIAITPERQALIQFTRPYMSLSVSFATSSHSSLAGQAPATAAQTLRLLSNARIGAQGATVNAKLVRSVLPDAILVLFDNQESLDDAVANAAVDAGLAATQTWKHQAPAAAGAIVTFGPPLVGTEYPVLGQGLAIGVAKGNDALKASLDTAICRLTADGTIGNLSVKWFGDDLTVPCD
jgi:octopine/nopaline transport system substrate-binding protein